MARDRDDRDDREEDEGDRPRRRPRDDRDDDVEDRRPPRTTMPGASRAAGIIWIIVGALSILPTLGAAYQVVVAVQFIGVEPVSICTAIFTLTLTLFCLVGGIKTVAGGSTEPIANGVISILFSLVFLGVAALLFIAGLGGAFGGRFGRLFGGEALMIVTVVILAFGLLMLLAGIMVLAGRNEYVRYRQYWKARRRAEADRYRDRDDDEDDRPRRRRPQRDDDE